jgi:hypothetical protein
MKDLGIAILGYNRPEYLYICLDSVIKAGGTNIHLYLDGPINKEVMNRTIDTISCFPIKSVYVSGNHMGQMESHLFTFRETFNFGYERVLFLEEDLVISNDAIQWIKEQIDIRGFWLSLSHHDMHPSIYDTGVNIHGLVMTKKCFDILENNIRGNTFWGLKILDNPPLCEWYDTTIGYDGVWFALSHKNNWIMQRSPISRVAHFGFRGCSTYEYADNVKGEIDKAEQILFTGSRDQWLPNLLEMFVDCDNLHPEVSKMLFPKWFKI